MKTHMLKLLTALILFHLSLCGLQAETIRFAPLPMENWETVITQFRPMTDYLEQRLNVKIEYEYSEDYDEIIEKFRNSRVDLAYLGPLPYVQLRTDFSAAEPLVHFNEKSGEALYTCAIVSFPDAGFSMLTAKDRKIALTQPLSTCGYLSTNGLLKRQGCALEHNYFKYLGKHDEVALAIIRGEFDAGGLKTAIARNYAHLGLQILAETPPMPAFALVGNTRTLSQERLSTIREVLVGMDPQGKDKALLSSWGENVRYGAVKASDGDYQPVRELLGNTTIPKVGNIK